MGFCRRCGDIVSGVRCQCGGTAVAPVVSWNQLQSKVDNQDKWSKTYVSRERSPTRSPSPTRVPTNGVDRQTGSSPAKSQTKQFPRPISSGVESSARTELSHRVATHITSTTCQLGRPSSPLKFSTIPAPEADILPSLNPHTSSLAKVYGSVLQPKETLEAHCCAICAVDFPPDATIYPDPRDLISSSPQFLCRPCFTINGGSKGTCPSCARPVLILKAEGGFVHAAGQHWHKRCFNCEGCSKNIGDKPMVDLLGRPSCPTCFESCLTRDPSTPKKAKDLVAKDSSSDNIGGMRKYSKPSSTPHGSPAVPELELKLGISKSRESSPALEELGHRLSSIGKGRESSTRSPHMWKYGASGSPVTSPAGSPSPVRYTTTGSPAPTEAAIEEMKQRFLRGASASPSPSRNSPSKMIPSASICPPLVPSPATPPALNSANAPLSMDKLGRSTGSIDAVADSLPPTPDLVSDFSDTLTQSSGPDSPPHQDQPHHEFTAARVYGQGYGSRYTRGQFLEENDRGVTRGYNDEVSEEEEDIGTPTPGKKPLTSVTTSSRSPALPSVISLIEHSEEKSRTAYVSASSSTLCAHCGEKLFAVRKGGDYVEVPEDPCDNNSEIKTYHSSCFRCKICDGVFREGRSGQAMFVKGNDGPCHVECLQAEQVRNPRPSMSPLHISASTSSIPTSTTNPPSYQASSRYERPPTTAPPTMTSFPRFGSSTSCPGCHKSVSPMERGVVPGPQGTRWHASCLVCGGKKDSGKFLVRGRGEERKKQDGCGKKLDSAAKMDGSGGVWCRECLLLLPHGMRGSPQSSPLRSPIISSPGGVGHVAPQMTGMTTIARQFTGIGGDPALLRQLTGGGLSPTRQLASSPTKQLGLTSATIRPRPRSIIGMRSSKTVEDRRGPFLVR